LPAVVVLALKLILAPAFVVGASLVGRRFGPRVGGLVGGLPVVGGPILLVLAVVHDDAFAARAASASLLGLISLAAFVVAYGVTAQRRTWPLALLAAWSAFLGLTALFALLTSGVHVPPTLGLAAAFMSFFAARALLPRDGARPRDGRAEAPPAPPSWDLPVRALCAAAMVLAVTAASSGLGARVSGLLAPSPIITSVLAAFTQAQAGPDTTLRLLRGMLTGFFSFALFCWTTAVLLPHAALGVTFAAAVGVAALTQVGIARGESIGSRPYSR
jgi:hypothetical protein